MSRVGKNPVQIPEGVEVTLTESEFKAKGKLGELACALNKGVKVTHDNDNKQIVVVPTDDESAGGDAIWGTVRANVQNVVTGVTEGFKKTLEVNGVGYRANVQGNTVVMTLGKSHDDKLEIPAGLKVAPEKPNLLIITGADKQLVGAFAAKIRSLRPPEPYKGKGVKYQGEYINRKEGKKK